VNVTFSSAQLNAVAICLFLSLNLSQAGSNVELMMLDDPIQNMDDYNVLGLLDLLRGFVPRRQLILSTHDAQLAEVIRTKLRPLREGARMVLQVFDAYDQEGPIVHSEEMTYEPEPFVMEALAG
jgi:ABC-type lipoprotein export system ATPase subunit